MVNIKFARECDAVNAIFSIPPLNSDRIGKNNDGILQKGEDDLVVRLLVNSGEEYYMRMAAEIRQQLSLVGIKVKVLTTPPGGTLSEDFFH